MANYQYWDRKIAAIKRRLAVLNSKLKYCEEKREDAYRKHMKLDKWRRIRIKKKDGH